MGNIVRWVKRVADVRRDSRGALLIEVLIGLAILGIISVVFIGALYTSLHAARITDERTTAVSLARTELEFVKGQRAYSVNDWDYTVTTSGWTATNAPTWLADKPADYISLAPEFAGYTVTVTGDSDPDPPYDSYKIWSDDEKMRLLTATVSLHGETVYELRNYQLDRYFAG